MDQVLNGVNTPQSGAESQASDKTEAHLQFLREHWGVVDQDRNGKFSREEVDTLAADETAAESVRDTARFLQKDFDDLRALNDKRHKVSDEIELGDLKIFADGYRQISMDRLYFNDAKKFAVDHFDQIDSNENGKISAKEIDKFVKQNGLSDEEQNAAEYLKHRLGSGDRAFFDESLRAKMRDNRLPFVGNDYWVGGDFGSLSREQILSMDLSQRISQTERSLYVADAVDGYHSAGKVMGFGAGGAAGMFLAAYVPVPPLTNFLPMAFGFLGAIVGGEVGLYIGRQRGTSLYEQHHKGALTKIMGSL